MFFLFSSGLNRWPSSPGKMVFVYPRLGPWKNRTFPGGCGIFLLEVKSVKKHQPTSQKNRDPSYHPQVFFCFFFILAEKRWLYWWVTPSFGISDSLTILLKICQVVSPFSQAWLGCQIEKHVQKNNSRRQISAPKISKPLNLSNRQIAKWIPPSFTDTPSACVNFAAPAQWKVVRRPPFGGCYLELENSVNEAGCLKMFMRWNNINWNT